MALSGPHSGIPGWHRSPLIPHLCGKAAPSGKGVRGGIIPFTSYCLSSMLVEAVSLLRWCTDVERAHWVIPQSAGGIRAGAFDAERLGDAACPTAAIKFSPICEKVDREPIS